jgi:hypothetical protein
MVTMLMVKDLLLVRSVEVLTILNLCALNNTKGIGMPLIRNGGMKMKCVICNLRHTDDNYRDGSDCIVNDSRTCVACRTEHYPKHLSRKQYQRYWNAFHKLYLERSKDVNEKSNEEVTSRTSD